MLSLTDLRGQDVDPLSVLPRAELDVSSAMETVRPILDQVRDGGVQAVLELGERFDGIRPPSLRVPTEALQRALDQLDPAVRAALEESISRARRVHSAQIPEDSTVELGEGALSLIHISEPTRPY